MDLLVTAGRTLGFSLAAGVNLYATVAMLGLATRFGLVRLPPQFAVFDNPWIIGVALVLYVVEFVADKVPWVDTLWDTVHTLVRPLGGALIAVTTLGEASPWLQGLVAVAGGTWPPAATSPRPARARRSTSVPSRSRNWALSLAEDVFVVGLGLLALKYPLAALVVTAVCVLVHRAAGPQAATLDPAGRRRPPR